MAIIKLHSEHFPTLDHAKLRARLAELREQYPSADINARRVRNYGFGYNITVKGEGQGKIQTRANCQFCGRDQVVKGDKLVKHGYRRPGTGYEVGRCPGAFHKPLQLTDADTIRWLAEERETLAKLLATMPALEDASHAAQAAFAASGEYDYAARNARPYLSPTVTLQERRDKHAAEMKEWAATYPAYVAQQKALDAVSTQRAAIGQSEAFITHFQQLIARKLPGTPYLEVEK